ncbi:hypothetical protein M404DRAFT_858913 [Pisolithus tinctorius Marx 270]|uniref:Uncharacterized protein n=1 Tax=Pisolithus tinctorius Marx 270 TaxID=870435 RepID=A0A0C3NRN3_PISTI|nr:hypothetical protein M404DRAFT_858913 [Pisolithus tinctorius Marx 270]
MPEIVPEDYKYDFSKTLMDYRSSSDQVSRGPVDGKGNTALPDLGQHMWTDR